ncbi:MAG TPA: hypothetical protein DEH05_11580, partial [Propionibacteriaceae bacterium]|nr:hypothetical protein [Propionibacteriaceae bacterium]
GVERAIRGLTRSSFQGDPWATWQPPPDVTFSREEPELAASLPEAVKVLGRRVTNVVRGRSSGREYLFFQAVGRLGGVENIVCVELPGEWPPVIHGGVTALTPTQAIRRFAAATTAPADAGVKDLRAGGRYVIGSLDGLDTDVPLASVTTAVAAIEAVIHTIPLPVWTAIAAPATPMPKTRRSWLPLPKGERFRHLTSWRRTKKP